MADVESLKQQVADEVDKRAGLLIEASHEIWEHPELNYQEHFAHELLTGILDDEGLSPQRAYLDVPTAFRSDIGTDGPTIAVLCEYDALPDIGHACGHNVIATAGLGAGLAAAAIAEQAGGRVVIMGTPAEEGGGGKCMLAERGAFDGIDAAMMVHPAGGDLLTMNCVAIHELWVDYEGESAHAAAFPHKGRNALDAAVLGYMNVAALRQHILPTERIHGIFSKAGDKPNIVPRTAQANWYVRSPTVKQLQPLKQRVANCLEAGATASGCSCTLKWAQYPYTDMIDSWPMANRYAANADRLGRTVHDPRNMPGVVGSTDMGNVSYLVPSIHPMIKVGPPNISIHTPEFAGFARAEVGDQAVIDGAKALAMTIIDLWTDAQLMADCRTEHAAELARRK
jgi:amidohydrolase